MINLIKIGLLVLFICVFGFNYTEIKTFITQLHTLFLHELEINQYAYVQICALVYVFLILTNYLNWLTYSYIQRVKVITSANPYYIKPVKYVNISSNGEFGLRFAYITYQYLCLLFIITIIQSYGSMLLFALSAFMVLAFATMWAYAILVHMSFMLYVYLRYRYLK
jgi:hypothetical protein